MAHRATRTKPSAFQPVSASLGVKLPVRTPILAQVTTSRMLAKIDARLPDAEMAVAPTASGADKPRLRYSLLRLVKR